MQKQKQLSKQQDIFYTDDDKLQWTQLKDIERHKTLQLLAQLLLSLSESVNHEGAKHAIENKR